MYGLKEKHKRVISAYQALHYRLKRQHISDEMALDLIFEKMGMAIHQQNRQIEAEIREKQPGLFGGK